MVRTEPDVDAFNFSLIQKYGDSWEVPYFSECYEAMIPRSFWSVSSEDVYHNLDAFRVVRKYCAKRKMAQRLGFGLLFLGDNGTGKTMFASYILTQMIRRGCSVYYTTLAELDADIKRGFKDREHARRMDSMLASQFLVIDEMGKDRLGKDVWLKGQLEMILKRRCDDSDPTILAANSKIDHLRNLYGTTIASMLDGKYEHVKFEAGDFRSSLRKDARKKMGLK